MTSNSTLEDISICPCSLGCYLIERATDKLRKDNLALSMSEKRTLQVKLQEHRETYCDNSENRGNCNFFKIYKESD